MFSKKNFAFIAAFLVQLFYGVTFTFANDVIDGGYIKPYGFILLRLLGATALFWIFSFLAPKEKISPKDFLIFIVAAFFGVALNMLTFFKGLSYTTPIHASVIMVVVPILVLIMSAVILKEKVTSLKIIGVVLGLSGALVLTLYGKSALAGDNILFGNFLVFINAVSYSIYIIIIFYIKLNIILDFIKLSKMRCFSCNKKLNTLEGLTNKCRCGNHYCSKQILT